MAKSHAKTRLPILWKNDMRFFLHKCATNLDKIHTQMNYYIRYDFNIIEVKLINNVTGSRNINIKMEKIL